ncbi:MAG TPA: carboxymuconolactone decarboxylase family protein [Propionibacteriaceae bacterium]|nr:carboxymuconolactone decarboxylase family protein [Propionibacteriaceae bacterium]
MRARLFFAVASRMAGGEQVDDVFKTILYRPALVGGPAFTTMIRGSLRGPSEWSVGERELFAAATSQANACTFCADIHSRTATLTLGSQVTPQIVEHADHADFRPQAKAMIRLIEKVSQYPDLVTTQDVDAVRAAGVSEAAIEDGLAICFAFNLINRLADAFEYDWDNERHRTQGARALVRFGYRAPRFLMR